MLVLLSFVEINGTLSDAFKELVPAAALLVRLAQAIGGLGALIYLSYHIWLAWVREESFDLFVLARPFVIGLFIAGFPQFVGALNAGLGVISRSTEQLSLEGVEEVVAARREREELRERTYALRFAKINEFSDGFSIWGGSIDLAGMSAAIGTKIQEWFLDLVEFLCLVASLAINILRMFHMSLLAIFGPIIWGLAVWEGLAGGVKSWLTRYVQVFLWLPICHILQFVLSRLETLMIRIDIQEYRGMLALLEQCTTLDEVKNAMAFEAGSIWPMMLFYVVGITAFLAVPSMAGYFVEAGSGVSGAQRGIQRGLNSMASNKVTRGGAALAGKKAGAAIPGVGVKVASAARLLRGGK